MVVRLRPWKPVSVVALALMLAPACERADRSTTQPATASPAGPAHVKIGVILPLTGDAAAYGSSMRQGMELALDETNASSRAQLVLKYEDSQADPKQALAAYRKLANVDGVTLVLGPFTSSETLAIAPAANKDRVVVLSTGASSPAVTTAGDYIFRIVTSDFYDADVVARFASRRLSVEEMAVVFINNEYGVGVRDAFLQRFKELGGQIVSMEGYLPTDPDFKTLLAKVREAHPEALFLVGHQEMGKVLRQAREVGIDTPVISTGLFEDPAILETAGRAAEGVYYSFASYNPDSANPVVERFASAYQERFASKPDILAALGYDAVKLVGAIEPSFGVTASELRDRLYQVRGFDGVTGEMSFDKNGDVEKSFGIKQVKDGEFAWIVDRF